jgi:SAM-dependent methyltransferase
VTIDRSTARSYAASFDAVADVYDRARPPFHAEVVAEVLGTLDLDGSSTVLDLAAGTGRLTRHVVARVGRVVAVEPLPEMRRVLAANVPTADVRPGTAQAIPLDDAAVDAVVVGEALHWFHDPASLAEIRRVIRPGGGLGLFWTRYDEWRQGPGWLRAVGAELERRGAHRDPGASYGAPWRANVDASGLFEPLASVERRQVHRLTVDGLLELLVSFSELARLETDEREAVLGRVRTILAAEGVGADDDLALGYRTVGFHARVR